MSVNGIIMFLGINNTRLERKILIILDVENGFYLPIYHSAMYYFIFLRHLTEIWHRIAHSESVEEELFGVSSLLLFIK